MCTRDEVAGPAKCFQLVRYCLVYLLWVGTFLPQADDYYITRPFSDNFVIFRARDVSALLYRSGVLHVILLLL